MPSLPASLPPMLPFLPALQRILPAALLALPTAGLAFDGDALELFDHNDQRGVEHHPGKLVVKAAPGAIASDIARVARATGCAWERQWGDQPWHTVYCPADRPLRDRIAAWSARDDVAWVEAAYRVELTNTPDDLKGGSWHHYNYGQNAGGVSGTSGADISSVDAWDVETGDGSVIVAVVDTGLWTGHADLENRIALHSGETSCSDGVDNDGNGYVDDCYGWDMGDDDNDTDPRDLPSNTSTGSRCSANHGTFIGGLVAGEGDNGVGHVGVLWDVRLLPLKMTDENCDVWTDYVAEGMMYAATNGAQVITASWKFSGYTAAMRAAFSMAQSQDIIVAISAGNDNVDADTTTSYPIDFGFSNNIVVAATTNRDARATFSNWGKTQVDLAAPGHYLRSTDIDHSTDYATSSGTSFSSPLVAGAAAMVWTSYPSLYAWEVKASINEGADPISKLTCGTVTKCVATGARLNLAGALDVAEEYSTRLDLHLALWRHKDDGTLGSSGDGDSKPELTEVVAVTLDLLNDGHIDTAGSVRVTLDLSHPDLTVLDDTIDTGPIAAETSVSIDDDGFLFEVHEDCMQDFSTEASILIEDLGTGEAWDGSVTISVGCVVDLDRDGSVYPYDCDDGDADVFPGADELCNGIDDDCDDEVDEDDAVDAITWHADLDGDGYGDAGSATPSCEAPEGWLQDDQDCDDARAEAFPGADELCNDLDDDCDTEVDEQAVDPSTFWPDGDDDGFGAGTPTEACDQPAGYVDNDDDCDDSDADAWPGAKGWKDDCTPQKAFLGCYCTAAPSAPWGAYALLPGLLALIRRRRA